ncbi:MAG: potassium-transporting ATPase subunit F [Halobacteriota archaeon]
MDASYFVFVAIAIILLLYLTYVILYPERF